MSAEGNEKMGNNKKRLVVLFWVVLLLIAVPVTMYVIGFFGERTALNYGGDSQYVLYIGTNDKDSYRQIIPTEEAKAMVNEICSRHVDGFTASEAVGGWMDEKGVLTQETTLVYVITGASEQQVLSIMNEALVALNQNSILVESRSVRSAFYNGRELEQ